MKHNDEKIREQVNHPFHTEYSFCKNCGGVIEELYHNIYRHCNDVYRSKTCECGCINPEPQTTDSDES